MAFEKRESSDSTTTETRLVRVVDSPRDVVCTSYVSALETTMQSSTVQMERLRCLMEEARVGRVDAERREESVKTELINAESRYALAIADLRRRLTDELEAKVEQRVETVRADAQRHVILLEQRSHDLEAALGASRAAFDDLKRSADDRFDEERERRREAQEAATRDLTRVNASRFWLAQLLLIAFALLLALLIHARHLAVDVDAADHRATETAQQLANLTTRADDRLETFAQERALCASTHRNLVQDVVNLLERHYFAVSVHHLARIHKLAVDAAATCGRVDFLPPGHI